ncbi:hypothetical protein BD289DRAFT_190682 [Coniella lustricola]|uniref:Uncharacterized protein n=1 Tax=Coniella lustricola TaxID=2025994 RepID=A0A2T2ZSV6_9PEZI|nr:hypothetical protein BD289DRAFT_190682 [Coniella lustricola]
MRGSGWRFCSLSVTGATWRRSRLAETPAALSARVERRTDNCIFVDDNATHTHTHTHTQPFLIGKSKERIPWTRQRVTQRGQGATRDKQKLRAKKTRRKGSFAFACPFYTCQEKSTDGGKRDTALLEASSSLIANPGCNLLVGSFTLVLCLPNLHCTGREGAHGG